MTTPFVQYGYANGSANTVRPESVTYPDGREIALDYGSAGSMADALSRVGSIIDDDNTHLADYAYLGERSFVTSDLAQPDVKWTLASLTGTNDPDTGDIYTGLDRFGRVKDNRWYDYGASADADRIKYGYDRAGNRTWRQNTVADAQGKHFDEVYGNDLIHRLKELARGTLNAKKDGVTSKSFAECWSLDPTGNWKKFLEDTNGDGTWNLDQARSANPVNEITGITESAGPSWATPAYSAAGNMTTVPQPADPTKTYTATYDAWNRLVKLVDDDTDDTVAEYQYDGANRRIVQKSYDEGDLQETRHLYYTQPSQWQVVEERVEDDTDPDRQFVWGLRYIDDLVLRDRDTNGDGSLNERLFALQDANWNLTGLIDTAGDVQERCVYSAYGTPLFLTPSFGGRVSSSFDWETLYAGYRWETATELFHVRHRVLNSALGTWCQRDPQFGSDIDDLYSYLDDRPLAVTDPLGLMSYDCLACALWGGASYGPGFAWCFYSFPDNPDSILYCLNTYFDSMQWWQHALPVAACAVCFRGVLGKNADCAIAAAYSTLKGSLSDSPFHVTLCKAAVSCVIAMLVRRITKNKGIWEACGVGVAAAGANTVAEVACNKACGKNDDTSIACYGIGAAVSIIGGCIAKWGGGVLTPVDKHVLQFALTIVGHDFKTGCKIAETW